MYVGIWKNGYKYGEGKYINRETGSHIMGMWDGESGIARGIEKWIDGSEYSGQFLNEIRHGKGKLVYQTNEVYVGEFYKGVR